MRQAGVTAVEFALIAWILILLLIGIMEIARIMFVWNSANEATRYGARAAVVCPIGANDLVLKRMQTFLPMLTQDKVSITYPNVNEIPAFVSVEISGLTIDSVFTLFNFPIPIPASRTIITAESFAGTASTSWLCNPSS
ncbi:MAG: TadE/TadG family type IV pilus assembly protein [Quisquiliibacterium sp.]